VYSHAYKQYLYYQTLVHNAEKDYIDEKTTVENSSDEKLKKTRRISEKKSC
jgi:hypothetical protein